jgi:hypothetical protein
VDARVAMREPPNPGDPPPRIRAIQLITEQVNRVAIHLLTIEHVYEWPLDFLERSVTSRPRSTSQAPSARLSVGRRNGVCAADRPVSRYTRTSPRSRNHDTPSRSRAVAKTCTTRPYAAAIGRMPEARTVASTPSSRRTGPDLRRKVLRVGRQDQAAPSSDRHAAPGSSPFIGSGLAGRGRRSR